jgi:hypothetical protein
VERRPSKRPERFMRDVRASMGMLKRDMLMVDGRCGLKQQGKDTRRVQWTFKVCARVAREVQG